jgi:hypothetical protein
MSHYRLKTTYQEEGDYGSRETKNVYAHHNLGVDYVTFYDDRGEVIMSIPSTIDNNLLDAINRLYSPFTGNFLTDLIEGVEHMTLEEKQKCGL